MSRSLFSRCLTLNSIPMTSENITYLLDSKFKDFSNVQNVKTDELIDGQLKFRQDQSKLMQDLLKGQSTFHKDQSTLMQDLLKGQSTLMQDQSKFHQDQSKLVQDLQKDSIRAIKIAAVVILLCLYPFNE